MAFSFGASNPAGATASAELGPELPDVFTDVCPIHWCLQSPKSVHSNATLGNRLQGRIWRC